MYFTERHGTTFEYNIPINKNGQFTLILQFVEVVLSNNRSFILKMKMIDNLMFLLELEESCIIFQLLMENILKVQQEKCLYMLKLRMKNSIIMMKNAKMGNY